MGVKRKREREFGEAALTTECECHAAFIEGKRGGSWVKTLFWG